MRDDRHGEDILPLALECLAASGHLRLRVTGASMLPGIRSGSYVLIQRATPEDISVGDVILARATEGVRLHRLIAIHGSGEEARWITRGDNHEHFDPPLKRCQVLGVLARVEEPDPVHWFHRLLAAGRRRWKIA